VLQATGTGDYQYYTIRNVTDLMVGTATEEQSNLAPPLTASYLNYPTNGSNMIAASGLATNFLSGSTQYPQDWNVAVYADQGVTYYIFANTYCPNGCQGEEYGNNETYGTCNEYTGVCSCESHYGNLNCIRTSLAVVWIVLIVIACAIILAIAIGVPVAIWLRNRNRSRYERV